MPAPHAESTRPPIPPRVRHLVLALGDQLNADASAWDGFDPACDLAWMAEVAEESERIASSAQRTVLFLSAMRHFAQVLRAAGRPLHYRRLDDADNAGSLGGELAAALREYRPERVVLAQPGDWRVLESLRAVCAAHRVPLDVREDRHFFCTLARFERHARGRKSLRMEYFYREMRREHAVLMDGDAPAGGEWNFDAENRSAFGRQGPGFVPAPLRFAPDAVTDEVVRLVQSRGARYPGRVASFGWPVTRAQALEALASFIAERLPLFGTYQDAMWPGQPWLYHAHIGSSLNLKLLNPREVVAAAEAAYRSGAAPLAAVEGFIRQILGWREYVRGIYWTRMPDYAEMNELGATHDLPPWFWTGETDMACLRDAIGQTLEHGYAHHIQRLMVTGLYALLHGVEPKQVHAWYLAVYVDAVEWVELPNTLGMSQFADGGLMASKPYAATGKYIERMSGYCTGCRYKPDERTGARACPYTTLYWDFLMTHEKRFANHPRMALQIKNLARIDAAERRAIAERAAQVRAGTV